MIKARAQAIPIFAMTCFNITKSLCDEISNMIGRYWWLQQDKDKKIHWLGWEKLTCSKKMGPWLQRTAYLLGICPRGNNKMVYKHIHVYDNSLFSML